MKLYDLGIKKKYYFRIKFCSDLMCNRDIKGWKFVCVGSNFEPLMSYLYTKYEQKSIWFCTPIIFKNMLKIVFLIRNILITICVGGVWIIMRYLLFEKQTFDILLKVIGIQKQLLVIMRFESRIASVINLETTSIVQILERNSGNRYGRIFFLHWKLVQKSMQNGNVKNIQIIVCIRRKRYENYFFAFPIYIYDQLNSCERMKSAQRGCTTILI